MAWQCCCRSCCSYHRCHNNIGIAYHNFVIMSRIFISYKRVDKEKVFKIKNQIESTLDEWVLRANIFIE